MTRQPLEVDRDAWREKNVDAVAATVARVLAQQAQIIGRANQSFGEKKTGRQLIVVSRSAHRYNERARVDADFQRLFDGQGVARSPRLFVRFPTEDLLAYG